MQFEMAFTELKPLISEDENKNGAVEIILKRWPLLFENL